MRMMRVILVGLVATLGVVIALLLQDPPGSQPAPVLSDPGGSLPVDPVGRGSGPPRSLGDLGGVVDRGLLSREEQRAEPGAIGVGTGLPPELLSAEIRVRVEQESGEPVAGTVLELELGVEQLRFWGWSIGGFRLEQTSDAFGRALFRVPPVGIYQVRATRGGFAPSSISPVLPGDDLKLSLTRGRSLTGQVVSLDSGAPVEGAALRLSGDLKRRFTVSDGEGDFRFEDLADGPVRLDVWAEGFDLERVRAVDPDRDGPVRVELSSGADFHGQVVEAAGGRPIPGAEVHLGLRRSFDGDDPVARTTKTDASGEFHFARISRTGLELALTAPGFAESIERVSVKPEDSEVTQQFSLVAEGQVSGIVRRSDGTAVEGAEVTLDGRSKEALEDRTVQTDPEGRFQITGLLPGQRYGLGAVHRQQLLAPSENQIITVTTAEPLTGVEIVLEQGALLVGQVLDGVGQPVPYAQVVLEDLPARFWRVLGSSPVVFADEQGEFRFGGLPAALLRISARSGESVSQKQEVGLIAGVEQEILLSLEQGLSLSGVVVDTDGAPVEAALVSIFSTSRDFSPPQVPQVTKARAPKAGVRKQKKEKAARPSKQEARAEKQRRKSAQVREKQIGKLLERDRSWRLFRSATGGRRAGGATFRGLARSDPSGAFRLGGLIRNQPYVLVVRKEGFDPVRKYQLVPDEVVADRSQERRIVLSRLLSLSGMVLNSRTQSPLERFQVTARPVGDPTPDESDLAALLLRRPGRSRGFRSLDGSFELNGLRPGAYELTVRSRGFRSPPATSVELPGVLGKAGLYLLTPAAQVSGHVRKGDGTPLVGVPVFLIPQAEPAFGSAPPPKKAGKRSRRRQRRALRRTTDRRGDYLFSSVPTGHYQIGLGQPNDPLAGPLRLFVEDGGRVERGFRFDAVGTLKVEVRAAGGFGLRRARVRLKSRRTGASYSRSTDEDGRVEFTDILADEYGLRISARGYEAASAALEVQPGDGPSRTFSLKSSD